MPQITYDITISPTNTELKGGSTFSATLSRNSTPPSGAYVTGATIRFTDVNVYSSRGPYLEFIDYFTTSSMQQSEGFQSVGIDYFAADILNVSSASITVAIRGISSAVNAMNFKSSSATLVVDYAQSFGQSTATLSPSTLNAGDTMTVTISNPNLASLSHNVTWALGPYSYTASVGTGVATTSILMPLDWLAAIPSALSGTGTVTVDTYSGGTYIGRNSYVFTLGVPASVVPSVSSITAARIDNSVPSTWGIYVQNRSGVV